MFWFWKKKSLEELIEDKDVAGIINLCQKNSAYWDTADFLYNVANHAWQYYNDNEFAIKLYIEAIKYNNTDPNICNNLATTYKRVSDFDNSIKYYNLALDYDSRNPVRYLRPAFLYAYTWKNEKAITLLKKYFNIWWNDIAFIELCKNTTQWWGELLKLYNTF